MTRTYGELKADIFDAAMSGNRTVRTDTGMSGDEQRLVWQLVDDGFLTAYASRHCPDGHSMWGNRHTTLASFLEDQPRRPRRCRECPAEGGHDLHAEEDLDDTVQFTCTDKVPAPPTAAELQKQIDELTAENVALRAEMRLSVGLWLRKHHVGNIMQRIDDVLTGLRAPEVVQLEPRPAASFASKAQLAARFAREEALLVPVDPDTVPVRKG